MRVLFASSEVAPYAKSGGLGDVVGSLPKKLVHFGVSAMVIAPMYAVLKKKLNLYDAMKEVACYQVQVGWRHQFCRLLQVTDSAVPTYFVENDYYFGRDQFYGYYDDGERFVFFSQAVLAALPYIGGADIIHCHDWQTAVIPLLLHQHYAHLPAYSQVKTVFTIHNLRFQGRFAPSVVNDLIGLPPDAAAWQDLEFYQGVNLMKAALYHSDAVTTVSPTYAQEIRTGWYGEGLDGVLNDIAYKLTGIVNGIDTEAINPARDTRIYFPFSDVFGKGINKLAFQKELGLPQREDAMMVGVVSRLDAQKGFDLIECVMQEIMAMDVQFVLLGTQTVGPGEEPHYEHFFRDVERQYPDKARCMIRFDLTLAQKIYASSDLFLMPSAFEPCGLSQMMAMRYGTLPLVRETGGLKDTVAPYNAVTGTGTGFSFTHYNAHDMLHVLELAVDVFRHKPKDWRRLAESAMLSDFSWSKSAQAYKDIYQKLMA